MPYYSKRFVFATKECTYIKSWEMLNVQEGNRKQQGVFDQSNTFSLYNHVHSRQQISRKSDRHVDLWRFIRITITASKFSNFKLVIISGSQIWPLSLRWDNLRSENKGCPYSLTLFSWGRCPVITPSSRQGRTYEANAITGGGMPERLWQKWIKTRCVCFVTQ